jgi:hypothetical protein
MRPRRFLLVWPVLAHQGGWDEMLMIFGLPVVAFVVMRWLAGRRRSESDNEETR